MRHAYSLPGIRASADLIEGRTGWVLTRLEVGREARGKGYASRLLRAVIEDADTEGATLLLAVEPDCSGGLGVGALEAFYGRYGFEPSGVFSLGMVRRSRDA